MLRSTTLVGPLAFAVVILLTLPGGVANRAPAGAISASGTGDPLLTLSPGHLISSALWGTTVSPRAHLLPNQGDLVNATPVRMVVFPGAIGGDLFNPFNSSIAEWNKQNRTWSLDWVNTSQHGTSVRAFIAWCRSIGCTAIFQVPGEIDNASFAREIVNYTVNRTGLNFTPAFWEVGNEPGLWRNWNLSWDLWVHSNRLAPTPMQYALEVRNYTIQMDQAVPGYTPKILGLPGVGTGSGGKSNPWTNDTIQINGPNLSGIGIHVYPAAGAALAFNNTTVPSLGQFYNALEGGNSLGERINAQYRDDCFDLYQSPACVVGGVLKPSFPVFVTEFGTSLSHRAYGTYSLGFPGALGSAVEMVQAMQFNSSQLASVDGFASVFDTDNCWFNLTGAPRPVYMLFSSVMSRLGNDVFNVNVSGTGQVAAVATLDASDSQRLDLLVTNTNLSSSKNFSTAFINRSTPGLNPGVLPATFVPGTPVEEWEWSGVPSTEIVPNASGSLVYYHTSVPATPAPVPIAYYAQGLPASVSVPAQSLVLFESYNAPAYPVTFSESGLELSGASSISHWFLDVNGTDFSSNSLTRTLLLRPGSYPTAGPAVLTPLVGAELTPQERYFPVVTSPTVVVAPLLNLTVRFEQQWSLNISWNPAAGSVTPIRDGSSSGLAVPTWWTNNTPLSLGVRPLTGYAFTTWYGQGGGEGGNRTIGQNGSVSGYHLTLTVVPTGPIEEVAEFAPGYPVIFTETGLPIGTPWNLSLRGLNASTTSTSTTFYELNGTWGYQAANVTGYRYNWWNQTVVVNGTRVSVPVDYTAFTPPGPYYPVTFLESGVASHQSWHVEVRGATETGNAPTSLIFEEHPGAYAFTAGAVGGYNVSRSLLFTVVHGPLSVTVDFRPGNRILWNETGLGPNLTWAVRLNDSLVPASGGWATIRVFNGSYAFSIPAVHGNPGGPSYAPNPQVGTIDLTGNGATIDVRFVEATFPVMFALSGLPGGAPSNVRLSNLTQVTALSSFGFQLPNGTYTFDVEAPAGYYASPSHGNVTVAGSQTVVAIAILPIGRGPTPPFLSLALPAVTAAIVLGLSGAGTFALLGAIRRRRTGAAL